MENLLPTRESKLGGLSSGGGVSTGGLITSRTSEIEVFVISELWDWGPVFKLKIGPQSGHVLYKLRKRYSSLEVNL